MPADMADNVVIQENGTVTIKHLDNDASRALIDEIHGKQNFGKKLFCNGFIPLTPKKQAKVDAPQHELKNDEISATSADSNPSSQSCPPALPPGLTGHDFDLPALLSPIPDKDRDLVRRHSISLRTPPGNSIAAEILGALASRPDLNRTKSLVNDLKECISDFGSCVSDFGSCMSESSESGQSDEAVDNSEEKDGFQTMNEKRRKRKKRKLKVSPGREDFLKKPNLVLSPQGQ